MTSGSGGPPKSIGHYVLMKTIGEGTFGKVKLGTHILTGERVAVKVLEKERIVEAADVERVAREIHILKLIRKCRHIIQLYEMIETPRQLYLIMEYAPGGELFDYIVERGRAEESEACRFLHQILAGVERVHEHCVVHRDLKPENLLLTEKKDIKIVDFGLSNTHREGELLYTACGSPCYAAPEMIASQKYHPPMVDIWSCGVILFALVCGYLPFEDPNHTELYRKICAAEYEMPDFVSDEVADLIRGMLTTDPAKRLTLTGIRDHTWYKQMPEASLKDFEDDGVLDDVILEQLDAYGFPRDYSVTCLLGNKHNHLTTTYYLLKERRFREADTRDRRLNPRLAELESCGLDEEVDPFRDFNGRPVEQRAALAAVATPSRGARTAEGSAGRLTAPPSARPHDGPLTAAEPDVVAGSARGRTPPLVPRLDLGGSDEDPAQVSARHAARPATARGAPKSRYSDPGGGSPADVAPRQYMAPSATPDDRPLTARGSGRRGAYGGVVGDSCYGNAPAYPSGASRRRPSAPCSTGGRGYGYTDGYGDRGLGAADPRDWQASPRYRRGTEVGAAPLSARGPRTSVYRGAGGHHDSRPADAPSLSHEVGFLAQDGAAGSFQVLFRPDAQPRQVVREVMRGLAALRVNYRQMSTFLIRMQEQGLRVQAEVVRPALARGYAVRLSRASGDPWQFKDLCERLLAEMRF